MKHGEAKKWSEMKRSGATFFKKVRMRNIVPIPTQVITLFKKGRSTCLRNMYSLLATCTMNGLLPSRRKPILLMSQTRKSGRPVEMSSPPTCLFPDEYAHPQNISGCAYPSLSQLPSTKLSLPTTTTLAAYRRVDERW